MAYIEIEMSFQQAEPWKDIFTAMLGDAGCDSFMDGDTENVLLAYIKEDLYNQEAIEEVLLHHGLDVQFEYHISKVEEQDWNAVWEANYEPVLIENRCYIRAPFHEPRPEAEYEIVIEPKMSFGTAHHETTSLMISYILEEDFQGKSLLDMGSGTGVLSILAYQRGARPVMAVDNDKWAYENNLENNMRNDIHDITVLLGDANAIKGHEFDVIFANINRNILLNDMPVYAGTLHKGGCIFFSGFYQGYDLEAIKTRAKALGLTFVSCKEKNQWVAAKFVKE